MVFGQLTFISGGVRSGKSAFAEKLLVNKSSEQSGRLVYLASGMKTDVEMRKRIEKHRFERAEANWTTFERPVNLEEVLPFIQKGDLVLWDCVTTWLANELYAGSETGNPCIDQFGCMAQKETELYRTVNALLTKAAHLVIVSNEVFDEQRSIYAEVRIYSEWLGRIHQMLVQKSDTAIEMDSGLPTFWKGGGVK